MADKNGVQKKGRGRNAANPGEITLLGWKDVLSRLRRRLVDNNLSITAAGVAFYALIATFPGLLVLVGLYGMVFDREQTAEQLEFLQSQLQPEAVALLVALLRGLSESDRARLGLGIGALLTLWSASVAMRALIKALNIAYDENEKRSLLGRTVVALLLTGNALLVACLGGVALMSLPLLKHWSGLDPGELRFFYYARWPLIGLMFWVLLVVFYRYGPSRAHARWSWVSWGGLAATAWWLSGTGVLAWYVASSRSYHQAYGAVGVIVLVLAWYLLSAFSVLLGAEVNAELERQTRRDTTVGPDKPAGQRGASVADTLGEGGP